MFMNKGNYMYFKKSLSLMLVVTAVALMAAPEVFARAGNSRTCHLYTNYSGRIKEIVHNSAYETYKKSCEKEGVDPNFLIGNRVFNPTMTCESRKISSSNQLAGFYLHDHSRGDDFITLTMVVDNNGKTKELPVTVKRNPRTPGLFTYTHVATGVKNNGNNWKDSQWCRDDSSYYIQLHGRFDSEQTYTDSQAYTHILARIVRHFTDCIPESDDCQITMSDMFEGYFSKNYLFEDDSSNGAIGNKEVRIP